MPSGTKGKSAPQETDIAITNAKLDIFCSEIELALSWNRPSILLAVHTSKAQEQKTQRALEDRLSKLDARVHRFITQPEVPDVARLLSQHPAPERTVFFVSNLGRADKLCGGKVFRALNLHRELIVENSLKVVFWLRASDAAKLPRIAPDFWAFRHQVTDFSPKRDSIKKP